MRVARNFCLYRQRTEPSCFIPDILDFPKPHQPIRPHIFAEEEIIRLFEAVKQLKPTSISPLRQEDIRLALTLLYTAGLRRMELLNLTIGDYDSMEHTLLIRDTKFHKSRIIPLSEDGWKALESYLKVRRKQRYPFTSDLALIWNRNGLKGSYSKTNLWYIFRSLFRIANIHTLNGGFPRIHDFRHTFAVHALLRWYYEDVEVQAKLPMLSIYMGHVSIVSTQYYLRFIEKVVNLAGKRFEENYGSLVTISDARGEL